MFCPQTIVLSTTGLMITRHERSDYHQGAPLLEKLNPLRYSITIHPGTPRNRTFNRSGWLARQWSDVNWLIWKRRWVERFD
jgi:hypothetical protein